MVIPAISIGIVVSCAAWLCRRWQQEQENLVLDALNPSSRRWQWFSGQGVVARMKRDALYAYASALFPPRVNGWSSFIARLAVLPLQCRYFYHHRFVIPSKKRADRILRGLWRRGLLVCAPKNSTLYRLKEAKVTT